MVYRAEVSNAITRGIRVQVRSQYLPERSQPLRQQYVFAYTITITNEGSETAQLKARHWIIRHGDGDVQEVRGEGVVGEQPTLRPGQRYEYTSGCSLHTPRGSMEGTYQMVTADGRTFDARIAPFALALPHTLN